MLAFADPAVAIDPTAEELAAIAVQSGRTLQRLIGETPRVALNDSRFVGTNLENPSFAAIAAAMGGAGIKIDAPDQVGDALREAVASNRPACSS